MMMMKIGGNKTQDMKEIKRWNKWEGRKRDKTNGNTNIYAKIKS